MTRLASFGPATSSSSSPPHFPCLFSSSSSTAAATVLVVSVFVVCSTVLGSMGCGLMVVVIVVVMASFNMVQTNVHIPKNVSKFNVQLERLRPYTKARDHGNMVRAHITIYKQPHFTLSFGRAPPFLCSFFLSTFFFKLITTFITIYYLYALGD